MYITVIIGIVFTIVFYIVYTQLLEWRDSRFNWVRPPLPLWVFLLLLIIELIPVFNLVVIAIIIYFAFGIDAIEKDIRFRIHSKSKIFDFLNYDLNANSRKNN